MIVVLLRSVVDLDSSMGGTFEINGTFGFTIMNLVVERRNDLVACYQTDEYIRVLIPLKDSSGTNSRYANSSTSSRSGSECEMFCLSSGPLLSLSRNFFPPLTQIRSGLLGHKRISKSSVVRVGSFYPLKALLTAIALEYLYCL